MLWSSRLSSMSPLEPVSLSSFSSGGSEDFSRSSEDLINLSGGKGFKESLGTVESSLGETSTSVKENYQNLTPKKISNSNQVQY